MAQRRATFDSAATSIAGAGFSDLWRGLRRLDLAWHLALRDIRLRYRRTVLGPMWTVVNAIVFVSLLGVVYSMLFKTDLRTLLPYLTAGYFVWITLMAITMEACTSFASADSIIKSAVVPFSVHILRNILRNFLTFLHMAPVSVGVSLLFGHAFDWMSLAWFGAGLVVLLLNAYWVSMALAVITTRYRDFQQIVATILQMLFFITPIFWPAQMLDGHAAARLFLADLNPVYQLIQLLRAPLLGEAVTWPPYAILGAAGVTGIVISTLLFGKAARRVGVWL